MRYLQPGPWQGHDPFGRQKRQQEVEALARLAASWEQLAGLTADVLFETLLHSSLWGNRADLSNLTVTEQAQAGLATRDERHLLLIDHTAEVHALAGRAACSGSTSSTTTWGWTRSSTWPWPTFC